MKKFHLSYSPEVAERDGKATMNRRRVIVFSSGQRWARVLGANRFQLRLNRRAIQGEAVNFPLDLNTKAANRLRSITNTAKLSSALHLVKPYFCSIMNTDFKKASY